MLRAVGNRAQQSKVAQGQQKLEAASRDHPGAKYKEATELLELPMSDMRATIESERRLHQLVYRIRTSPCAVLQYNHNRQDLVTWFW
jgi:hypothetical protein